MTSWFFVTSTIVGVLEGMCPVRWCGPGFWLLLGPGAPWGCVDLGRKARGLPGSRKGIRGPIAAATAWAQKWPSSLPLTLPSPSQGRSKAGEHALEKDEPMNRGMAGAWAPPCALGHKEFTLLVASRCFSSPPSAKIHSPLSPPPPPSRDRSGNPRISQSYIP